MVNVRMDGTWGDGIHFVLTALAAALILGMGLLAAAGGEDPAPLPLDAAGAGLLLLADSRSCGWPTRWARTRRRRLLRRDLLDAGARRGWPRAPRGARQLRGLHADRSVVVGGSPSWPSWTGSSTPGRHDVPLDPARPDPRLRGSPSLARAPRAPARGAARQRAGAGGWPSRRRAPACDRVRRRGDPPARLGLGALHARGLLRTARVCRASTASADRDTSGSRSWSPTSTSPGVPGRDGASLIGWPICPDLGGAALGAGLRPVGRSAVPAGALRRRPAPLPAKPARRRGRPPTEAAVAPPDRERRRRRDRARPAGGPERHREKARAQGKLPVRERVERLLDPGSFAEEALLANWEQDGLGADGVVTGMGTVGGPAGRRHGQRPDGQGRLLGAQDGREDHPHPGAGAAAAGADGLPRRLGGRADHRPGADVPGPPRRGADLLTRGAAVGRGAAGLRALRAQRRGRRLHPRLLRRGDHARRQRLDVPGLAAHGRDGDRRAA